MSIKVLTRDSDVTGRYQISRRVERVGGVEIVGRVGRIGRVAVLGVSWGVLSVLPMDSVGPGPSL